MNRRLLLRGQRFSIYVVDLADAGSESNSPVMDFLTDLKRSAPASYTSMYAVMQRHADHGPIHNERRSRMLRGSDGIYEFKNRQGERITYFYPSGERGVTILTDGFRKGARVRDQIRRAQRLRALYYEWRNQ